MAIEMSTERVVCSRCGTAYPKRKGNFPVCYGLMYKGTGTLHICKTCADKMYNSYLSQCKNAKDAIRQMCRKLDLYWSPFAFENALKVSASRNLFTSYLAKINMSNYAGKCYDDSLSNEGTLWSFNIQPQVEASKEPETTTSDSDSRVVEAEQIEVTDEIIAFWGPGYTPSMYSELEQRRQYWLSHLPEGVVETAGLNGLLRQICSLEIDINKARASGGNVDKLIATLNTLIGSAMLKPAQNVDSGDSPADKTPFGVWIKRWEDQRPIPEPDPQFKDVDNVVRYIEVYFKGHLSKMLGLRNSYSKMYEEEMEKYKLQLPEYEEDDDETLFNDIFSQKADEDDEV